MSESKSKDTSYDLGWLSILTLLFIALKLGVSSPNPVESWSWWWVLSPSWGPAIGLFGFFGLWYMAMVVRDWLYNRKRDRDCKRRKLIADTLSLSAEIKSAIGWCPECGRATRDGKYCHKCGKMFLTKAAT